MFKLKTVAIPFIIFVVLVFLWVYAVRISSKSILSQKNQLEEAGKTENTLIAKKEALKQFDQSTLNQTDSVIAALPGSNPALPAISQIKSLAGEKGIFITSLNVGRPQDKEGALSSVPIALEATGSREGMIDFSRSINVLSPLITLDKVSIEEAQGVFQGTFTLSSYWALLPEKIPAIESPISEFTGEERDILNKILSLRKLVPIEVTPAGPQERSDPFN